MRAFMQGCVCAGGPQGCVGPAQEGAGAWVYAGVWVGRKGVGWAAARVWVGLKGGPQGCGWAGARVWVGRKGVGRAFPMFDQINQTRPHPAKRGGGGRGGSSFTCGGR